MKLIALLAVGLASASPRAMRVQPAQVHAALLKLPQGPLSLRLAGLYARAGADGPALAEVQAFLRDGAAQGTPEEAAALVALAEELDPGSLPALQAKQELLPPDPVFAKRARKLLDDAGIVWPEALAAVPAFRNAHQLGALKNLVDTGFDPRTEMGLALAADTDLKARAMDMLLAFAPRRHFETVGRFENEHQLAGARSLGKTGYLAKNMDLALALTNAHQVDAIGQLVTRQLSPAKHRDFLLGVDNEHRARALSLLLDRSYQGRSYKMKNIEAGLAKIGAAAETAAVEKLLERDLPVQPLLDGLVRSPSGASLEKIDAFAGAMTKPEAYRAQKKWSAIAVLVFATTFVPSLPLLVGKPLPILALLLGGSVSSALWVYYSIASFRRNRAIRAANRAWLKSRPDVEEVLGPIRDRGLLGRD